MGQVAVKRSTIERGYGPEHRRERRRWAGQVALGNVACARCGRLIEPGTPWDLGHDDHDRTRYQGPEHARCNRLAGAKVGGRRRAQQRRAQAVRTGLTWTLR